MGTRLVREAVNDMNVTNSTPTHTGNANRLVAMVFGYVFVAIGLLGFIMQPTLIIFGVNNVHNVIHLVSGIALLAAAYINGGVHARTANLTFGVVYLLVAILGFARTFVYDMLNMQADLFPHADNALHLLLGVVFLGAAFAARNWNTARTGRTVR